MFAAAFLQAALRGPPAAGARRIADADLSRRFSSEHAQLRDFDNCHARARFGWLGRIEFGFGTTIACTEIASTTDGRRVTQLKAAATAPALCS